MRKRILYKNYLDRYDLPKEMLSFDTKATLYWLGWKSWIQSKEYDYFGEVADDIEMEIIHDVCAYEYSVVVSGKIEDTDYAYYLMKEKK